MSRTGQKLMPTWKTNAGRLRERWLQAMFLLTLAWALFWFISLWYPELIKALNPSPEGHWTHLWIEDLVLLLVTATVAGVSAAIVFRFWPGFLRVPRQATSLRVLISLIFAAPITGIALFFVLGAVSLALDPPWLIRDNPQYIPAVFWIAPLGTIMFTPVASVVGSWLWAVRRNKGSCQA